MNANTMLENSSMDPVKASAQRALRDQRFNWLRPLRRRRLLVTATLGMLLWFGVAVITSQPLWGYSCLLLFFVGMWLLRISTRAVVDIPDQELDERILIVRNQMFRSAHITGTTIFAFLLVSSIIKFGTDNPYFHPGEFFGMGFGFFFLMLALPTAFYAWTEPEI